MNLNHDFIFETPAHYRSIIKVVGVGGGGGNAVNHMFRRGIKGVDFVVMNTDVQALNDSPVPGKLQLGVKLTEGLGAGSEAKNGEQAALESIDEIKAILDDHSKMVFITAGMGGGTGTGAAPVIAKVAKDLGLLTVAIVTAPFGFEGKDKKNQAMAGIELLQNCCDTVLVILNDKLAEMYQDLDVDEAFEHADNILTNAAKSIAEVITKSGKINVDFNDVKTVLKDAGQAVMGSASASGEDRAVQVVADALHSPLLNNRDITGAKRILVTVAFSSQCKMKIREQTIITDYILEKIGHEPNAMKLGFIHDEDLGDEMRITVIAAGYDSSAEGHIGSKYIKIDGYDTVADKVIDGQGLEDHGYEPKVATTVYSTYDLSKIIELYTDHYPSEADLEEAAFLRNKTKLSDLTSSQVDGAQVFRLLN